MTDLPKYSLNHICVSIDSKLKQNYFQFFLELFQDEDSKDRYIEEYVTRIIREKYSEEWKKEAIMSVRNDRVRYRQKLKKRWYEKLQEESTTLEVKRKSNPTISQEIVHWQNHLKLYGEQGLKDAYKANSIDELIQNRLNQVYDWVLNKDTFLTDFIYTKDMTSTQLETAFELDFFIAILEINIKDFDGDFWHYVAVRPEALINPIFGIKGKRLKTTVIQESNPLVEVNENIISKNLIVRTIIEKPENVSVKMTALDALDSAIINYILSKRDEEFLTDGVVTFEMADLLNKLYPDKDCRSGLIYEEIENRIDRLRFYSLEIIEKKGNSKATRHGINILQHTTFTNRENGRRIGIVTFSNLMHEQIVNGLTVRLYVNQIRNLSLKASQILIYPLQQERLECHRKNKGELVALFGYDFFNRNIIFPTKNKEANLRIIESSLLDCKDTNFVIEDFQRNGDCFEIRFLPLQDYEIQDLIGNSDNSYNLLPANT